MKTNENKNIYSNCKDCCCEKVPGIYSPDDIVPFSMDHIVKKLVNNEWIIDNWEGEGGNENIYFLSPSIKNGAKIFDPTWGGICNYLTKTGCVLKFNDRPLGCKMYIPMEDNECYIDQGFNKYKFALLWKDHQKLLLNAGKKAEEALGIN